jgi:hypothetical protein
MAKQLTPHMSFIHYSKISHFRRAHIKDEDEEKEEEWKLLHFNAKTFFAFSMARKNCFN